MRILTISLVALFFFVNCAGPAEAPDAWRWDSSINFGWKFSKGSHEDAFNPGFDDSSWESVDLPHDWAISGPFGAPNEAGNTGKLPWKGEGWYRKTFTLETKDQGKQLQFLFDGVMASPVVYLNGEKVGSWRYGYNSFWIDATEAARFGEKNVLAVHADTKEHHSRWYPGAGIYRKVQMRLVEPVHIPVWGVYITTPEVTDVSAAVHAEIDLVNTGETDAEIRVECVVLDPSGVEVQKRHRDLKPGVVGSWKEIFKMTLDTPILWDIENPALYVCKTSIYDGEQLIHQEKTKFGIRDFKWTADDGYHLNGRRVQLKGVNLHHDQGPLGAAFFPRAMERQLEIMQEMGVNALRTSHNAPAPEVLELCDEMGIIVFNELFDKYGPTAGVECSTAEFVNQYAEPEVKNFVLRDRNHPSVVLWSIGNEIPDLLADSDGKAAEHVAKMVDYFTAYDTTRPTTMGCHIPSVSVGDKHILDPLETTGWNYARRYFTTREAYPEMPLIYSETASAFGTRGAYKLDLPENKVDYGTDGNISAYMLTAAPWSDIPEIEFEYMRIDTFVAGEFVWTGFDYLGEPTPYTHDRWGVQTKEGHVARSSYFGIVDLAGLPKDSYYNYRSQWNEDEHTIELTPHWNWEEHEGEPIPVFLYTDGDEAELFLNGKSLGKKSKLDPDQVKISMKIQADPTYTVGDFDWNEGLMPADAPYYEIVDAYRIQWLDVPYEMGTLKAVAYKDGKKIGEDVVQTAGLPAKLRLSADRTELSANGMDLCYVTVEMVDEQGVVCPLAMDILEFEATGSARLMGVANGDAMSHDRFTDEQHPLFFGKAVAVMRNIPGETGPASLTVSNGEGIKATCQVNFAGE